MFAKKGLAAAVQAAAAADVYVEDVFSTYLYTGTDTLQTITNGIDLSTNGGMVWLKVRSLGDQHAIFDTARGISKSLASNLTSAQYDWAGEGIDQFNSDGFRLDGSNSQFNSNGYIYTSWTFRKAAKFFDVVTYTGDGSSSRAINHNLGSTPGCVIVRRTDSTGRWKVYHRSEPTKNGNLNDTSAFDSNDSNMFFQGKISAVSSTTFTVAETTTGVNDVNGNTYSYVAYLFAHDAGGFGDNNDQSIIKCGSFTTDGNGDATVSLGWEPQWVMVKASSTTSSWRMVDITRGNPTYSANQEQEQILANLSDAGTLSTGTAHPLATGFRMVGQAGSTDWVYIAIRRGPMKTPTDATKVFQPVVYTGTNVDNRLIDTTIAPDFVMIRQRNDTVVPGMYTGARLTGQQFMITGSANAGARDADSFDQQLANSSEWGTAFSSMSGVWVGNDVTRKFNANTTSNNHIIEAFKRAPGFMDVVCYTGNGGGQAISHNLGAVPQMMLVKNLDSATGWRVYHVATGNTDYLILNTNAGKTTDSTIWDNTTPTSTTFTVGTSTTVNQTGSNYIAILFATVSGVSKVGSYTGVDDGQTVNCGFTSSARFVLIKRADAAANWYLWDTARGLASGNDPYILLDSTAAEVTNTDYVNSNSTGFEITSAAPSGLDGGAGTFIYLAIA